MLQFFKTGEFSIDFKGSEPENQESRSQPAVWIGTDGERRQLMIAFQGGRLPSSHSREWASWARNSPQRTWMCWDSTFFNLTWLGWKWAPPPFWSWFPYKWSDSERQPAICCCTVGFKFIYVYKKQLYHSFGVLSESILFWLYLVSISSCCRAGCFTMFTWLVDCTVQAAYSAFYHGCFYFYYVYSHSMYSFSVITSICTELSTKIYCSSKLYMEHFNYIFHNNYTFWILQGAMEQEGEAAVSWLVTCCSWFTRHTYAR